MVEIAIKYEGKLRCRATHGPSEAELITDAPKDNQGEGASFSPTDLVATALGSCMMTIMAIAAERMSIDLKGAEVKVSKEMVADPLRRIGKLAVEIHVPAPTTEEQRQKLQNAAMTCPVHRSLSPETEIPVSFAWGSEAPVLIKEKAHH